MIMITVRSSRDRATTVTELSDIATAAISGGHVNPASAFETTVAPGAVLAHFETQPSFGFATIELATTYAGDPILELTLGSLSAQRDTFAVRLHLGDARAAHDIEL